MKKPTKPPGYVDAKVQFENAILVMREISRIQYLEDFRALAPGIAVELQRHGVRFPKKAGK